MTSRSASGFLFFAYDGRIDDAAMKAVNPACEKMGPSKAEGRCLQFTDQGVPNLGLNPDEHVWGMLWVVPAIEMANLDQWAAERGLRREVVMIICPAGPKVPATAYLNASAPAGDPNPQELQGIIHAASNAKIDAGYIAKLRRAAAAV